MFRNQNNLGFLGLGLLIAATLGLSSCGGVLPEKREVTTSEFTSFDNAYQAYSRVVVNETNAQTLAQMGYNVLTTPNIELLTYLDVAEIFLPQDSIPVSYLPENILKCIEVQTRCSGYAISPRNIHAKRVGNVVLDFLDFRRTTHTTGWEVEALFVLIDDVVVYKLWSGTPHVDETVATVNPLGPVQDVGTILNRAIPDFD